MPNDTFANAKDVTKVTECQGSSANFADTDAENSKRPIILKSPLEADSDSATRQQHGVDFGTQAKTKLDFTRLSNEDKSKNDKLTGISKDNTDGKHGEGREDSASASSSGSDSRPTMPEAGAVAGRGEGNDASRSSNIMIEGKESECKNKDNGHNNGNSKTDSRLDEGEKSDTMNSSIDLENHVLGGGTRGGSKSDNEW